MKCKVPGMSCEEMECSFGCAYEEMHGELPTKQVDTKSVYVILRWIAYEGYWPCDDVPAYKSEKKAKKAAKKLKKKDKSGTDYEVFEMELA